MIETVNFSYQLFGDLFPNPKTHKKSYFLTSGGLLLLSGCSFYFFGYHVLFLLVACLFFFVSLVLFFIGLAGGEKNNFLRIINGKLEYHFGEYAGSDFKPLTLDLHQVTRVRQDTSYIMFITKDKKEFYINPKKIRNKAKRKEFIALINTLFPPIYKEYYTKTTIPTK